MENPIKMDDLGVPLFLETPIWKEWEPTCFATSSSFSLLVMVFTSEIVCSKRNEPSEKQKKQNVRKDDTTFDTFSFIMDGWIDWLHQGPEELLPVEYFC